MKKNKNLNGTPKEQALQLWNATKTRQLTIEELQACTNDPDVVAAAEAKAKELLG
jgi:hypothetical protein